MCVCVYACFALRDISRLRMRIIPSFSGAKHPLTGLGSTTGIMQDERRFVLQTSCSLPPLRASGLAKQQQGTPEMIDRNLVLLWDLMKRSTDRIYLHEQVDEVCTLTHLFHKLRSSA
jgi:hypothetical protein